MGMDDDLTFGFIVSSWDFEIVFVENTMRKDILCLLKRYTGVSMY